MIGREDDLARLTAHVEEGQVVTITGPPGVGKTRLAQAFVDELRRSDPHATVLWCDLHDVGDDADLPAAVAALVGYASLDALVVACTGRRTVLVLDGCDRAIERGLGQLVDDMTGQAPDLHVLATSRRPLAVAGEFVQVLDPLSLPSLDASDDEIRATESVQLYMAKSAEVGAAHDGDANVRAIARLVRELDGLPQAIVLAAARSRAVGPVDMLARLDKRLDLLRVRGHTSEGGAESVRAAFDMSYELLAPYEQELLRRLSVFRGAVAADLAHAACGSSQSDEIPTVDALAELVDRSLVQSERGPNGVTRFRLLNLVRVHAAEKLDAFGERDDAESNYVDALAAMADAFVADAGRGWNESLVARMLGCYTNLLGAIDVAIARDADATRAFRLYLPLYSAIHGGHAGDVAALGARLLARWPTGAEQWRAEATAVAAAAHLLSGDGPRAVELADRAMAEPSAGVLARLVAQRTLAFAAHYDGRTDEAISRLDRAVSEADEWAGSFQRELRVVRASITAAHDPSQAARALEALAEECAAADETATEMWALVALAHVLAGRGDLGGMQRTLEAATRLVDALDHPWGRGAVARLRAFVTTSQDGWPAARREWRAALDAVVAAGDQGAITITIATAAELARSHGAADDARALFALGTTGSARTILPPLVPLGERPEVVTPAPLTVVIDTARAVFSDEARREDSRSRDVTPEAFLRREGDTWSLGFAGSTASVRHAKGLDDLAKLVATPGVEIHCLDLMGAVVVEHDTGPTLDQTARVAYERRIRELQEDLDEAAARHDRAREELVQAELDALVDELSRAVGKGGRDRPTNATVERARSAVRWRVRAAIDRVGASHPDLGRHLDTSVTTGVWCVYRPREPVAWTVATSLTRSFGAGLTPGRSNLPPPG